MAAWEAVRLLASTPSLRPRRSIRLVCFTDEECRASGAAAYAQQTAEELDAGRLVAAIETDVGCGPLIGFGYTGSKAAKQQLADMTACMREWGWDAVCDDGTGVDIRPLIQRGVPGLLLRMEESFWTSGYFAWHHTHADTVDKIDPAVLTSHVQLLAMMLWLLAETEDRLPGDDRLETGDKAASQPPQSSLTHAYDNLSVSTQLAARNTHAASCVNPCDPLCVASDMA